MKLKVNTLIVSSILLLTACKKDLPQEQFQKNDLNETSQLNTLTIPPIYTPDLDWENNSTINLANGQQVILPWYNAALTNIPNNILEDYKKEDGWELLYDFCTVPAGIGNNYLIFYNKFTGIIRSYYFLSDLVSTGNQGMWALSLSGTSSLLNNVGYYAKPLNDRIYNPIAISTNITTDQTTKSIYRGWNCFETEITFDDQVQSNAIKMGIRTYDQNMQNITLTGSYNSTSEGTIISTNTSNAAQNFINNTAKAAGTEGKNWVKNNIGEPSSNKIIKVAQNFLTGIAGGSIQSIVKSGANLIFGSFIGRFNSTSSTSQKIEFKTNGTIALSGQLTSSSSSNVFPIQNLYFPYSQVTNDNIIPFYQKRLGVWNLDTAPVVKQSNKGFYIGQVGLDHFYERNIYLDLSSFNVVLNPDVLDVIDKYETSYSLVYYSKFQNQSNFTANYVMSGNNIYTDSANEFLSDPVCKYKTKIEPIQWEGEIVNWTSLTAIKPGYVVKVTVTLFPKAPYNQEPVAITRSYLPTYELFSE